MKKQPLSHSHLSTSSHKAFLRVSFKQSRGVALIMALMVFALVAAIASSIMMQLSRERDLLTNMQNTAVLKQQLLGGEAWARHAFALMEKSTLPSVTEVPLILKTQHFVLDDDDDSMRVSIIDRQNCYNLNRLTDDENSDEMLAEVKRLLTSVNLNGEIGEQLKDWIDNDQDISGEGGHEDEFYQALSPPFRTADSKLVSETELMLLQLSDEKLKILLKHFCAWPEDIGININRVSPKLLNAVLPSLTDDDSSKLMAHIATAGFDSIKDFLQHDSLASFDVEESDWRVDIAFVDVFVDVTLGGRTMSLHSKLYKANNGVVSSYYRAYGWNRRLQQLFGITNDAGGQ